MSRHRPRWWRWLWQAIGLIGLAGAAAACVWLFILVKQQNGQPGVAGAFLAVGGFVAAVLQVTLAWLQLRQGRGKSVELLTPHQRRERDARDRLRAHLGRQGRLRRMDDAATRALALRVHPAIDLPYPAASSAAATLVAKSQPASWRGLLLRPRQGQPHGGCALDPDLPTLVDRDEGPKIHEWMRQARDTGGFLLLVGDSCVGKTRLLYEAARKELCDFEVLVPDLGDGDLINGIAEATFRLPPLIVWLDELQRFLDGPYLTPGSTPITASAVRRLLDAPTPVIVVGTLWPQHAIQLRVVEPDPTTQEARALYPGAVDILVDRRLEEVTLQTFSAAERHAAARLASQDSRLAEALADRDYNVTEVLAGARELVRRYKQATEEQQAILHAAIDARRLGVQAPLTERLLVAAARDYLTTHHPDGAWFPQALVELTRSDRSRDRATAPLTRILNPDRSAVLGYTVADYLLQRFIRERRSTRVSAESWQALIDHTHDQDDLFRLALSADRRLLYHYAESLYRHFINAGHTDVDHWLVTYAAHRLADLLVRLRASDEEVTDAFQILINNGRPYAVRDPENGGNCRSIVRRLVKQGRHDIAVTILRNWKDAGDRDAATEWTELLIEQDRTDQAIPIVRTVVELGHEFCIEWWFQRLLTKQDQPDKATAVLRAFTDAGGADAARRLAESLDYYRFPRRREAPGIPEIELAHRESMSGSEESPVELWFDRFVRQGRTEEILPVLRALVDAGGWEAGALLADLLAVQGDEAALRELRARADAEERDSFYHYFDPRLADLLVEHGGKAALAELRARADNGSWAAAVRLADLLVEQGDEASLAELRVRADNREEAAGKRLAKLLVEHGDVEELRARADAGDRYAARRYAALLERQGDVDQAITIVRALAEAGDWRSQNRLVKLLRERGNTQEVIALLQAQAAAGDQHAAAAWAELLIEQGSIDQAIPTVEAMVGTVYVHRVSKWCDWLVEQGRTGEAIRVLRACADAGGDSWTAGRLVELLIAQNCIEEALDVLRTRANAGHDRDAADRLARLLVEHHRVNELRARADDDDLDAESRLVELLARQGDDAALAELRARADHDSWPAAVQLADLLVEQGDDAALTELRVRANDGDTAASHRLTRLLVEQGDEAALTELRDRADVDDYAARKLAELLGKHGDDAALAELRHRANAGDDSAAWWLVELPAQQGRLDELRARSEAGDSRATERLITLLAQQNRLDELWEEVDAGTPYIGRRLINLLDQLCEPEQADQRRFIWEAPDILDAGRHLIEDLLHQIGGIDQADRIRSFGLNPDGSIADGNPGGHQPLSGTRR